MNTTNNANKPAWSAARRIVRPVIQDPICITEAIDDLLTIGMDPALLLSTLDSLDDIAETARTRRQAKAAAASMRETMDAIGI